MAKSKKAPAEVSTDTAESLTLELVEKIESIDEAGANSRTVSFLKSKAKELRGYLSTAEETTDPAL